MIRISVTAAAFDAVAAMLPVGSILFEAAVNARGERWIWLERAAVDRLRAMRGRGEDLRDVILRLVDIETKGSSR
jgi:hypothetical protein